MAVTHRTALYRHYAADGGLLYVGISLSPLHRLSKHRIESAWIERVTDVRIEWFDTRADALEAERIAIQQERPAHNFAHSANKPLSRRLLAILADSPAAKEREQRGLVARVLAPFFGLDV
jgi:hypothetical protein